MNRLLSFLPVLALLSVSTITHAKWSDDLTADIRFSYVLTSDPGGSDQDNGDDNEIVTFNGDAIEGESGVGFAIGKRFDAVGVSLAYETIGGAYDLSGSVEADGDILLPGTEADIDVETFMLEIDYTWEINEILDWNVLAGMGQTTFDFSTNGTRLPLANGTTFLTGNDVDNSDTSIRFGAGISYQLSDSASLLTMLQYTNYGTAELKTGTGAAETTTSMDVESTEVSMRIKFDF